MDIVHIIYCRPAYLERKNIIITVGMSLCKASNILLQSYYNIKLVDKF
jgi:hypothetical protein